MKKSAYLVNVAHCVRF